jgi:uncharacterized membrane protein
MALSPTERIAAIKTVAVSSVIAAIVTALIVILALFVSPILSAVFSALPSSLVFFAASASIFDDVTQENAFDNFLFLVAAIFYILLLVTTVVWYVCHEYAFKGEAWKQRVWKSFGCAMAVWLPISILIIILYYTKNSVYDTLSPAAAPVDALEEQILSSSE